MMNELMPRWPLLESVMHIRIPTSAWGPLVIQFLTPLITKPSPSAIALVCCAAASEPALGSLSMKQPSLSPRAKGRSHWSFCSSLANLRSGSQTSELLTDMITPVEAQAALISSMAIT